jgi:hypothetical protein
MSCSVSRCCPRSRELGAQRALLCVSCSALSMGQVVVVVCGFLLSALNWLVCPSTRWGKQGTALCRRRRCRAAFERLCRRQRPLPVERRKETEARSPLRPTAHTHTHRLAHSTQHHPSNQPHRLRITHTIKRVSAARRLGAERDRGALTLSPSFFLLCARPRLLFGRTQTAHPGGRRGARRSCPVCRQVRTGAGRAARPTQEDTEPETASAPVVSRFRDAHAPVEWTTRQRAS